MVADPSYSVTTELWRYAQGSTVQVQIGRENHPVRLTVVVILGNSALDRLANASYQIVIEGASYREKLSPHRKLLGDKGGD